MCHSFKKGDDKGQRKNGKAPRCSAYQTFGQRGFYFTDACLCLTGQRGRPGAVYHGRLASFLSLEMIKADHPTACLADTSPNTLYTDLHSMSVIQTIIIFTLQYCYFPSGIQEPCLP